MRFVLIALSVATLLACSPIQKTETVNQGTGSTLLAGVGDVVVKIDRYRDLENIFGRADLYGRKTYEGFTEVRFLGLRSDGVAVFARKDVTVQSNETTMSRGIGFYIPNNTNTTTTTTGYVGNVPVSGTSRTSGTSGGTYIPPAKAETIVLPPDAIQILLDLNKEKNLIVSGRRVEVISASQSQISYRVSPE